MEEVSLARALEDRPLVLPMGVRIEGCGLVFTGRPGESECVELAGAIARLAGRVDTAARFLIGDLIAHTEARWGERYEAFEEATGLQGSTLRNLKWVATHVDLSRRRDKLSFTHHADVAALAPESQADWLGLAESESLSSDQLRGRIRDWKNEEALLEARRQRQLAQADPVQIPEPDDAPVIGRSSEPRTQSSSAERREAAPPPPSRPAVSSPLDQQGETTRRWHGPSWRTYVNWESPEGIGTMIYEIEQRPGGNGEMYDIRSQQTELGTRASLRAAKVRVDEMVTEALEKMGAKER